MTMTQDKRRLTRGLPDNAEPFADLGQFLPYLLNRVMARMNQLLSERLRGHGLSFQEWRILLVLANRGPRNIRALSEETVVPHSTLSRMLVRMERSGLITRTNAKSDARNVTLGLTAEGQARFEAIQHHALAVLAEAEGDIAPEDLARMRITARRMADNLGLN